MRELRWTLEAIQDREAIYDYVEADNPIAALALDELFEEKAGRLIDHPGLGRLGRIAGTRELVAHQNYILIYDVSCACCVCCMRPGSGRYRILHQATAEPSARGNQAEGAIAMGIPRNLNPPRHAAPATP